MTDPSKRLRERLDKKRRSMTPKQWEVWVEEHLPAEEEQMLSDLGRTTDIEERGAGAAGAPMKRPIHYTADTKELGYAMSEAAENVVKLVKHLWTSYRRRKEQRTAVKTASASATRHRD